MPAFSCNEARRFAEHRILDIFKLHRTGERDLVVKQQASICARSTKRTPTYLHTGDWYIHKLIKKLEHSFRKLINFTWFNNMKSRVKGDFQARFRENVQVRFLDVTRLGSIQKKTKTEVLLYALYFVISYIINIVSNFQKSLQLQY